VVDVFGGSGSVILASGFNKRVYNDLDGDLVNLFRVVADRTQRRTLMQKIRWTPLSREVFDQIRDVYRKGGLSFRAIENQVDRAFSTFYLHMLSFGGKTRSGGLSVSVGDRYDIKEVGRYRNSLRKMVKVGEFFRRTVIEHLHYSEVISIYGDKPNCVLFIDPPYLGTENYYSVPFSKADHVFLANQLAGSRSKVVVTYYDEPLIRNLYPESLWTWTGITATKNSALRAGNKTITKEFLLVKKGAAA
jgi:DNA adenine methylase